METGRDDFIISIRSAFLKKSNKQKFSLLSLILFSILFLILGSFNFKIINFNKTIIKEIIYYSAFIVNIPENFIKKSFIKTKDHFEYYNDYLIVKNELQKLKNRDLEKKIITFENIELKRLIDDYFVEDGQTYARVLADKESPFLRSIVINKGSKNGVKAGMVIYDDIYLIGKVVEVNFLTSRVLLISDINSKIPVTIQPLNIQGIMSGLNKKTGQMQYLKEDKLINKDSKELIVVTSGSGGIFKSGVPIGKINLTDILENRKNIIVNFYTDFSQLKYVKIISHTKENLNFDIYNKKKYETNSDQIFKMNSQKESIKVLQQQKIIDNEIRFKFESDNTRLKEILINTQKKLEEQNKKIIEGQNKSKNLEFLELNLLYGHKCRKSFFKPKLFIINTSEYRNCVLNKGLIKKTR
ncbi:rod shape-determining protein MreC [Candidatus Pelagibacter sp.]|nr:rod shape-determining protein MreC [Candidatus Pelagibacter sp.]|tara:strand:- start:1672 stop:2907 length:1236 start_codon:yes stop_codon:yes gene_type:complete